MLDEGLQTSRPIEGATEEGSMSSYTEHPPAIKVGFDWSQTARRVIFLKKNKASNLLLDYLLFVCYILWIWERNLK